jgi:HCNGP-like protein
MQRVLKEPEPEPEPEPELFAKPDLFNPQAVEAVSTTEYRLCSYHLRVGHALTQCRRSILRLNTTKMSALVSYKSSSDEEEAVKAISTASAPIETATSPAKVLDETSTSQQIQVDSSRGDVSDAPTIGPLLGPAAATNGDMLEEGSLVGAPEKMSERDAIRYLTQAPVPMTSMPPSLPGSPDPAANARFTRFLELKAKGVHFNEDLGRKSSFLNSGLLATMMNRAGIDEEDQYNTSLPTDQWDPKKFPEWAYKEGLLRSQQEIREKDDEQKKALSATGKRTIDFAPSRGNSGDSSRRSTPSYQKKRRRP